MSEENCEKSNEDLGIRERSDVIAFLDTQRKQQIVGDHEVSFDIQEWEEMVDQLRDITQHSEGENAEKQS